MTLLGELLLAFAAGGLVCGSMAYHSGLHDGAMKILRQMKREPRS